MSDPPAGPPGSANDLAARLRGFGPVGLLAIVVVLAGNLVVLPGSALLVLAWAHLSRTPWRSIGFVRPRSWTRTVLAGVVFGALFKLAMKALVMPLLGAPPVNARYHYLAHDTAALPAVLVAVVVGAGFGEETVFRGFFFERLGRLLGDGPLARAAIVLVTATLFGAAHWADQGLPGTEQALGTGLVFGGIYAVRRELPFVMIAHAAFDVMAVALIHWDLETRVAHWLFH